MKQILFRLFENLKQLGIKPNIGSRTNVTPIPGSEIDRLINRPVTPKEFDYSKPEVVDSLKSIIQNASDYVGQFTEKQLRTFNNNIERILGVVKPKETTAEVIDITTKEKITGPGLESLMKEKGVAPISRKTIEAETLIKKFLDDDLISLNEKQIDQLSRGKAEDVFENIFGSRAKELITGKNTNESLNEVYNKLKTTKDVKGRLPDDPNFDPSDIEFKEGGSVSEDVKQLLKEEFIKIINENPEAYPDTNAGFRRFLKRKGSPVFNYKDGGRVNLRQGGGLYPKELLPIIGRDTELSDRELEKLFLEGDISEEEIFKYYKKYPIKLGDLEINPRVNITLGNFSPDPFTTVSDKSQLSGGDIRYKIKDGIYATGSLDKQRNSRNIKYYFPFMDEAITQSDTYKRSPYTVGLDYEGDQSVITSTYDPEQKQFNVRGTYLFEPGGGLNKLFKGYGGMKKGGVASLFKKRKRYADGGTDLYTSLFGDTPGQTIPTTLADRPIEWKLADPERGPAGGYYNVFTDGSTRIPEDQDYYAMNEYYALLEQLSAQPDSSRTAAVRESLLNDLKNVEINKSKDPNYDIPLDFVSNTNLKLSLLDNLQKPKTTEVPTIDPFNTSSNNTGFELKKSEDGSYQIIPSGKPIITSEGSYTLPSFYPGEYVLKDFGHNYQLIKNISNQPQVIESNIPQIDPFSGQQVSAQDQLAFTQPQPEIFPTSNNIVNTLNLGSSDPLTNILGSQVGNLTYSEMNALRNRSPNVLSSNIGANLLQGLGTGLKDFAYVGDKLGSDYYKNLAGDFFENIKNLDKGFAYDPSYTGADKTGRLDYYKQGIKSLLGINTPGSNVGGGTPGMRYAIEQITPYLSKTIGPVLNVLGSTPVTALGVLDTLTGPANASEVGKGPEYFREQLKLQNSPVVSFNQVTDPRTMMAYGGLTKTIPPVRGPNPQGVESLFKKRYN